MELFASPKKRMKVIDYNSCVICQQRKPKYKNVINPDKSSFEKLLKAMQIRHLNGDSKHIDNLTTLEGKTYEEFLDIGAFWHLECYKNVTHQRNINSLVVRFNKLKDSSDIPSISNVKVGRPHKAATATCDGMDNMSFRGQRNRNFDKNRCILCQENKDDKLHEVCTKNMNDQLKQIACETSDEQVKSRLGILLSSDDVLAAVAYDMKYHLACLVRYKRKAEKPPYENDSELNMAQIVSDLEIIDVINQTLMNSKDAVVNMNDIQTTYMDILHENSIDIVDGKRYKPYLKKLILDNIKNVHFNKPTDVTKSEQVFSTIATRHSLSEAAKVTSHGNGDLKVLLDAAKILRREIKDSPLWNFKGTFDDYEDPPLLLWFCRYVIQGPKHITNEQKHGKIEQSSSIIAQHFIQAYKSDKQIHHDSENFRTKRETPVAAGLALSVHSATRSKSLIMNLQALHCSISYNKVLDIENAISDHVKENIITNGCYLPDFMSDNSFIWFALDNIDFLEDTASGKNTLHGTGIVMYQNESTVSLKTPLLLKRPPNRNETNQGVEIDVQYCRKVDNKPKKKIDIILSDISELGTEYKDLYWVLGCLNLDNTDKNRIPGTWNAFNSLTSTKSATKTNIVMVPPLIRAPPTDYNILYTGLMIIQKISQRINRKEDLTVVTLDMQLYDMAMKLWCSVESISKSFLFRPGELHIMFWSLAALGKYLEGSGIDQAWVEADMYSATTVNNQILKGKHLYRSLECHFVTMLSIYSLFFKQILKRLPDEEGILLELSNSLKESYEKDICAVPPSGENLLKVVNEDSVWFDKIVGVASKIEAYKKEMNPIQKFLFTYIKQFETILVFLRATRDRDIDLHLAATQSLIKYFFAHDHLNYARLLPMYVATMQNIKANYPQLWNEFKKGNFCITKSNVKFTSIGPDHGIEQENRKMKVAGGIVGITQNEKALERFFLAAPQLSAIVSEFKAKFGLNSGTNIDRHHDLYGSKPKRIANNVESLCKIIIEHGDPFICNETSLYNILTHAVIEKKAEMEILERDSIGQKLFEEFAVRLDGTCSVWSPMKKRNIASFKGNNKTVRVTTEKGKIISLKEERNLLQRFIIIARSRKELNMEECIGDFEFGVVPRSLFSADGSLLLTKDKYKVANAIKKSLDDNMTDGDIQTDVDNIPATNIIHPTETNSIYSVENEIPSPHKVILFDAMAIVNALPKDSKDSYGHIKTCDELAELFIKQLSVKCSDYDEVRLVFDRYLSNSLKSKTREERIKGTTSTHYRINDHTVIKNVTLKELLSDIRTKSELTTYLAEKALIHSKTDSNSLKRFMVTYQNNTFGNIVVPECLQVHDHEEADTLLLLHASTTIKDAHLYVYASDTDILLQLINAYEELPNETFFVGRTSTIAVREAYDSLGKERSAAIVGFHAFTGTDMTGKFSGRSKETCYKRFLAADNDVLKALSSLGKSNSLPDETVISNLERFVCILYGSKKYTKLRELRWFLYSHKQAEGENLPPTLSSLNQHIYRAHYMAMVLCRNRTNFQNLPSPIYYGWEMKEDVYIPVTTLNLPAPKAVINLVKCNCQKGCTKNCSCNNNGISCTEICGCMEYECLNPKSLEFSETSIQNGSDGEEST